MADPRLNKPTDETEEFFSGSDEYGDEAQVSLRKKKKAPVKKKSKRKGTLSHLAGKTPAKKKKANNDKPKEHVKLLDFGKRNNHYGIYVRDYRVPLHILIPVAIILILVVTTFFDSSKIEMQKTNVTSVGLPSALENYKIMVLSDLNGKRFGDEQGTLLRTINNEGCKALILLGDMVGKNGDPEPLYELIRGLNRGIKVYFICGDNDPGPYVEKPRNIEGTLPQLVLEDWILGAMELGATYVDMPVSLTVDDATIWLLPSTLMNYDASEVKEIWEDQTKQEEDGVLSGLQSDYNTLPITSYRERIARTYYNALKEMKNTDYYIVLSHEVPSDNFIEAVTAHDPENETYLSAPDLILAGHYCGGEWQLPLLGAIYIPERTLDRNGWFPPRNYAEGLRTAGESQVYTTAGLSVNEDTVLSFRFMNKPQLSVLTLTSKLQTSMLEEQ